MNMPFQAPAEYEPAIAPPEHAPDRSLWFVFRRTQLLVAERTGNAAGNARTGNTPAENTDAGEDLPHCNSLQELGVASRSTHYLGLLAGRHCFCAEADPEADAPTGWTWQGLRPLFGVLEEARFALAGRALQIVDWDRTHQYCGACAAATVARTNERSRECPRCGLVVYPRLAPAVMALVRRGRQLLLARSPRFAKGMYSALAGFVEPGETLEQCLAREVHEEVGIRVRGLRYFASQPWPFPHSLMIAFFADYDSGQVRPDEAEIEDARWFDIGDLPQLPTPVSIARRLIDAAVREIQAEAH